MSSKDKSNWNETDRNQIKKCKNSEDKRSIANEVFLKWLKICSIKYDYSNEYSDTKSKALRKAALEKLIEFINKPGNVKQYIIPHFDNMIDMIKLNLFRPLPIKRKKIIKVDSDDENIEEVNVFIDPAWPHLRVVHDILFTLITCEAIPARVWKAYVNYSFIQDLLGLLDNENLDEKRQVHITLKYLYAKIVLKRKLIRTVIEDFLLKVIHENWEFDGTSDLLDFLSSIIRGFDVPLRKEHDIFFKKVLVKLYKVQNLQFFFEELSICCKIFLTKDNLLVIPLIESLLRYWLSLNSQREILFMDTLKEILSIYKSNESESMTLRIFKRLERCLISQHLQVVDRAMCFFESDNFLQILREFIEMAFNIFVPIVVKLADTHWHKAIKSSFEAIKAILVEIDTSAFDLSQQNCPKDIESNDCFSFFHEPYKRAEAESNEKFY